MLYYTFIRSEGNCVLVLLCALVPVCVQCVHAGKKYSILLGETHIFWALPLCGFRSSLDEKLTFFPFICYRFSTFMINKTARELVVQDCSRGQRAAHC